MTIPPPIPPLKDRPITGGESRTLCMAMGHVSQEARLLRSAVVELTATLRERPLLLPEMRGPAPSAEDIGDAVADRLHRGTESDRVKAHVRNLGRDAFFAGAMKVFWLAVAALVSGVVVHLLKL